MDKNSSQCYSDADTLGFLVQFRMWSNKVRLYLAENYGNSFASEIVKDSKKEFQEIIMSMPFIGGDQNPFSRELIFYTQWLAVYRTLKKYGKSMEEIADILNNIHLLYVGDISEEKAGEMVEKWFSETRAKFRMFSQEQSTWKWKYIEGDRSEFDFGIDVFECGLLNFFKVFNAEELVPVVCMADLIWNDVVDLGLKRTEMIGCGDKVCNFRWKKEG